MKKLILGLLVVVAATFVFSQNAVAKCTMAPGDEWEVVVTGFIEQYSHQPISIQTQLYARNVATNEIFYPEETRDGFFFYLEEGTYVFDGSDYYWCGICSKLVTVDDNMEFVMEVWCE